MKTTKRMLLLITLSVMMIYQVRAQDPTMDWVMQMGGPSYDMPGTVAIDQNGNVITTGQIKGTVTCTFPGGITFDLTTVGATDVFIQKVSPEGNHIWTKHCGGAGFAGGCDVITDPAGNIIVTGVFSGTVDFDPGSGVFNLTDIGDDVIGMTTFILKLDSAGNFIWAKQLEVIEGGSYVFEINLDAGGNMIITGYFEGKVDFDPGPGTAIHMPGYNYQIFIIKLDANGNFIWGNELGGNGVDRGYSVTTDANMNVYTTGYFNGTVDFDPSKSGTYKLISKGNSDAFIQKSDPAGNFVWAKQMGGKSSDQGQVLTIDASGNLYTSGYFSGTVDFDPGPGIFNLTSTTQTAFIQKLDAAGNFVWVAQIEGIGTAQHWSGTWSINTDTGGNVYTTGYFGGSADFNPSASGTYIKTCLDTVDCYTLKLDGNGNFQWALQIGGINGRNCGKGITTDPYGNVYVTGFFSGDVSGFDPGNPEFQLHSRGLSDYFLQKLNQGAVCYAPSGLIANNISYNSATLNWNVVVGAGSYNVRYRVNGSADWITTADSVYPTSLSLNGLIPATVYEFQVQTNCVESQSGFSPSTTFTTLGPACIDSYEPNETQIAAKTIPANTNIRALIAVAIDVDWFRFNNTNKNRNINITLTNLPANYDVALFNAAGLQLGISENSGITDEIITYNTSTVGTYYVKVYGNAGAYDPLSCYTLKASIRSSSWKSLETGNTDDEVAMDLSLYPNPANTILNISFNSPLDENITLRFTDMSGRTFKVFNFIAVEGMNRYTIDLDDFRNGLYFIELTYGTTRNFRKVLINK